MLLLLELNLVEVILKKVIPFIFSAGYGSRLSPLTDKTPKPLLEIVNNKTFLDLNLEILKRYGFSKVLINYSYGKEKFDKLVNRHKEIEISLLEESSGIGHYNALLKNSSIIEEYDSILLLNGDTVVDFEFTEFIRDFNGSSDYMHIVGDLDYDQPKSLIVSKESRVLGFKGKTKDFYYDGNKVEGNPKLVNSLGVSVINWKRICNANIEVEAFKGFYGVQDMLHSIYKSYGLYAKIINKYKPLKYLSVNTMKELEEIRTLLRLEI